MLANVIYSIVVTVLLGIVLVIVTIAAIFGASFITSIIADAAAASARAGGDPNPADGLIAFISGFIWLIWLFFAVIAGKYREPTKESEVRSAK